VCERAGRVLSAIPWLMQPLKRRSHNPGESHTSTRGNGHCGECPLERIVVDADDRMASCQLPAVSARASSAQRTWSHTLGTSALGPFFSSL
jgi:hypothetical protein